MTWENGRNRIRLGAFVGILGTLVATVAAVVSASVDVGLFSPTRTDVTSVFSSPATTTQPSFSVPLPTSVVIDTDQALIPDAIEPTSDTTEPEEPELLASFDLMVGIRPQLGQVAESMEILLDGESLVTWSANQQNSPRFLRLEAVPGQHEYEIRGEYTYINAAGFHEQRSAYGSGTVTISDGTRVGVNYLGQDTFALTPY